MASGFVYFQKKVPERVVSQMVDKASSGGSLLDSIGGISGAIGLASKLFGK